MQQDVSGKSAFRDQKVSLRAPINLGTSAKDLLLVLSEGNPGAVDAMSRLLQHTQPPSMLYLAIDDMNLRGPRLAAAFDITDKQVTKFISLVTARDSDLVRQVNERAGGHTPRERAVCVGGS